MKVRKFRLISQTIWLTTGVVLFGLGYLFGHQNLVVQPNFQAKLVNRELGKPTQVDFSQFWEVWKKIEERSIHRPDTKNEVEGAIKGLVNSLGDPFSSFMTSDETKSFQDDLAGEFEGIGIQVAKLNGVLVVVAPLDGSPAQKAGLKAKDTIISIDNVPSNSLELEESINRIRGKEGTEVNLLIKHDGNDKSVEFKIKRSKITVKSVELKFEKLKGRSDEVAILKISQFGDDTQKLFEEAANNIESKKPAGIIIDLRNDPGGYLDTSVELASYFVDKGPIVIEEDLAGKRKNIDPTHDATLDMYPLVVLVNAGSASAAEIMAGAIQDRQEGKIVGETSFGKGSVQDLMQIGNGTLRLTIAKWLTPEGHQINEKGITPDIVVKDDNTTPDDEQLDAAKTKLIEGLK